MWLDGAKRECFLSRAAAAYTPAGAHDREQLVDRRETQTVVVLNRFPYNNGHSLVAPLRHVGEFEELSDAEHAECLHQIGRLLGAFRRRMNSAGFNVGLNLGPVAGAGVPGHLHWHVVPRWAGDNNFMPVTAATRVLPQSLDAVWKMLRGELGAVVHGRAE
jgi:ATP adenylyltransferase